MTGVKETAASMMVVISFGLLRNFLGGYKDIDSNTLPMTNQHEILRVTVRPCSGAAGLGFLIVQEMPGLMWPQCLAQGCLMLVFEGHLFFSYLCQIHCLLAGLVVVQLEAQRTEQMIIVDFLMIFNKTAGMTCFTKEVCETKSKVKYKRSSLQISQHVT